MIFWFSPVGALQHPVPIKKSIRPSARFYGYACPEIYSVFTEHVNQLFIIYHKRGCYYSNPQK